MESALSRLPLHQMPHKRSSGKRPARATAPLHDATLARAVRGSGRENAAAKHLPRVACLGALRVSREAPRRRARRLLARKQRFERLRTQNAHSRTSFDTHKIESLQYRRIL